MSQDPPPTLDYRGPDKDKPRTGRDELWEENSTVGKFLSGMLSSLGVSALIWLPLGHDLFSWDTDDALRLLIFLGTFKLLIAFALILISPRYRPAGIGILVSLPFAGMLVFGVCAANFRGH